MWLQGCSIGCPGCCSRDMWSSIGGATMSVSDLVSWCGKCAGDQLDGVSISGGEPFEQAEGLLELVSELGSLRQQAAREVDLLCYSGMPWRRLQKDHPAILDLLDVIVRNPCDHARFGIAARFDQPTTDCTVGPGAQTLPCGEEYAQKAPADRSE
ncbi:MAG: 4Fe-4S cluster-binding domain-containing protein [Candidatus Accumulibacter sp.]|uniref:4Fe-4S cluster-binding domain-containing protein n=1 Tax=Candidatus Accumulibacter proximus TaxID=2954385 RepID=A0A935PZQ6_9PROT|nr:4Fe-4S cluster-binding domain-containing protein [Candidatus Accumulibacter proximus]